MGGVWNDRVLSFRDIRSHSFGIITVDGSNVDVGEYILNNYLPSWIYELQPTYNVNITLSPKLYSFIGRGGVFNSISFDKALRVRININGSNEDNKIFNTTFDLLIGINNPTVGIPSALRYVQFDTLADWWISSKELSSYDDFVDELQLVSNFKKTILADDIPNLYMGRVRTITRLSETDFDVKSFFE